jgi:hypothetical protein
LAKEEDEPGILGRPELAVNREAEDVAVETATARWVGRAEQNTTAEYLHGSIMPWWAPLRTVTLAALPARQVGTRARTTVHHESVLPWWGSRLWIAHKSAALKELIHEQFGDGIMSAINFGVSLERREHPSGDRVVITLDGKFLPYEWPST